ncbi:MAG: hypothetical protein Q8R02_20320 [Hyphomonadaceae bacterium]|nr:hypothetical protein [Hyphomonadaceae bacterium]
MILAASINRRRMLILGAAHAAAGSAPAAFAQEDGSMRPSRVRHYVIAAKDLEAVCKQIYGVLDLEETPKPPGNEPTLAYGFRTRMMRIGTTMLEIVSPIREKHQLQDFFIERGGDGGFMVVMQAYDDNALLARAAAANHKLAFEIKDFMGQHLMQFDYKTFGTRFEFYKYTPEENWWGDPLNRAYNDPKAVEDIVGAEVAVENPGAIAETAAGTFLGRREGSSVHFIDRRIDFVAPAGKTRGLTALYVKARDRRRAGTSATVANVEFRFI